ncbi:uncharacterized protein F5147DRAFT_318831 [Suillus discolor]|uniref:Arrestin-like N-terminal domain-containing protein n=1 Tax=Suillus discolor TaxID=1912936 RepID=A0A9P7F1H6_9AGAM|nr:uncharacterized protein F5147DRAFT_318831 [Suillus discolor]KAG2101079.1 hypothetical protein F5147DRAFT_318831 [Suillus discolor]
MESIPPSYTPSPPSPSYSTQLLPGEQTVEETRRRSLQTQNIGVFRRITDSITLVLKDQPLGSITPVYGRNGRVRGHIFLRSSEGLVEVTLKLEGHLRLETSGAAITTLVVSESYSLWSSSSTAGSPCPRNLPFAISCPSIFMDGCQPQPLPPSFENKFATCSYTLSVVVSRPRRFLSSNDSLVVPVCYHPRSRPHTSMLPSDVPFMTTVKSSPEEWHQVLSTMNATQSSRLAPVQCLLFIPSVQVYPFSETIPFHLQLRAPSSSLAPFLDKFAPDHSLPVLPSGKINIRVYLLRQVVVKVFEKQKVSKRIIGEGKLTYSSPLPDNHHSYRNVPLGEGIDCLDWDGELRCTEDVTVGSFATNPLSVKDFIVLSLEPLQPLKCPLLASKYFHPIRLVTDPWSDHAVTW